MLSERPRTTLLGTVLGLLILAATAIGASPDDAAGEGVEAEQAKFFEMEVRPLLASRCFECHGEQKQKGGLRLDTAVGLFNGGTSGPAVSPGDADGSLMLLAVSHADADLQMPPEQKLPEAEIAVLREWVAMGAPWPGVDREAVKQGPISAEDRQWWAFEPVKKPTPPTVEDDGWGRNAIDSFVYAKLAAEGLEPADEADRLALMRRAYLDLVGLPPTPAEIEAYLADTEPGAYERLIDRLLASPRYGERWARHWLDLVRYADSDGYRADAYRPNAWPYRDYVIRSFNDDKPYDQFVTEQLAGDEIAPDDPDVLVATGYLRHWTYEWNQRDVRTQWEAILTDVTDVTADVFLGLGMSCARCHDHKFDPILQEDYFRLRAFFEPLSPRDDMVLATPEQRSEHERELAEWEQATAEIRAELEQVRAPYLAEAERAATIKFPDDIQAMMAADAAERTPLEQQLRDLAHNQVIAEQKNYLARATEEDREHIATLEQKLAEYDELKPEPLQPAFVATDVGPHAPPTVIPGDRRERRIEPGFLTVLGYDEPATIEPAAATEASTGRRTALAKWITRPENPLTARVMVNRIWQYHFGRGIVPTASDFGRLGEKPSHPELLDYLASAFVEGGWRLKRMHRLIMTSSTYRQSALRSTPSAARTADPENRWLWRANGRRMDAEQIRDAMLLASGELRDTMYGPSVTADEPRRSIYTRIMRNSPDPLLKAFDAPDGFGSTSERVSTVNANQSLLLLNSDWALQRAAALARRVSPAESDTAVAERAFAHVLGREPTKRERETATAFVKQQEQVIAAEQDRRTGVGRAIPGGHGYGALLSEGSEQERLSVADDSALPSGGFTVEAVIYLRSVYETASVRPIVAQWSGDDTEAGWSFGVTSDGSNYTPRTLILQLSEAGEPYDVISSDIHIDLKTPYYVAVSVRPTETDGAGIEFFVKDLSDADTPLQRAEASHTVRDYRAEVPLVVGGRHGQSGSNWDGLIGELRITAEALEADALAINGAGDERLVGHWPFNRGDRLFTDATGNGLDLNPSPGWEHPYASSPREAAVLDLCHMLLSSNEFLYVD